jgi:hypothetical protein
MYMIRSSLDFGFNVAKISLSNDTEIDNDYQHNRDVESWVSASTYVVYRRRCIQNERNMPSDARSPEIQDNEERFAEDYYNAHQS